MEALTIGRSLANIFCRGITDLPRTPIVEFQLILLETLAESIKYRKSGDILIRGL